MRYNLKAYTYLLCVILLILVFTVSITAASTLTVSHDGNANFTSIQEAVNNASDGDTIVVYPGTYVEHIIVQDTNLLFEGISFPTITGGIFDRMSWDLPLINIRGFNFSGSQLVFSYSEYNIDSNKFYRSSICSWAPGSQGTISNNELHESYIDLKDGVSPTIYKNTFSSSSVYSFFAACQIKDNIFTNTDIGIYDTLGSSTIKNNIFLNNNVGVERWMENGDVYLDNNTFLDNYRGVYSLYDDNIHLLNNIFIKNNIAIDIEYGGQLYATGNRLELNDNGIYIASTDSTSGQIYNNYFKNNVNVAGELDSNTLIWNISKTEGNNIVGGTYLGGNFWGTPDGTGFSQTNRDKNGDGICDESYIISANNIDYLPLENLSAQLPIANFTSNITSGYAPLTLQFTDLSNNATSWLWDFGDGTTSTEQNPIYFYSVAGNYTVTLTVHNVNGTDSKTESISVLRDEKIPNLLVKYNNRLREASPDSVFSNNAYLDIGGLNNVGIYRDVLWFDLSGYTNAAQINNAALSLIWYYPNIPRINDTVIEIYRPDSVWNSSYVCWNKKDKDIAWSNPGGDWYDKNGVLQGSVPYATLTLKASSLPNNSNCEFDVTNLVKDYISGKYPNTGFLIKASSESDNYIAFYGANCKLYLSTSSLPTANFTSNVTGGYVPLSVQFNDRSDNAAQWYWDFGDSTNSTQRSPKHTYSRAGNYTVNLTVSNQNGISSKTAMITVLTKLVFPVANFSTNVTAGTVPLSVQFNDLSKNATSWNWNFGDGTNSTQQNPVHAYTIAGNYTVNLTAINANGTSSKLAMINVSEKTTPILPFANFSSNITSGYPPLAIQFTDLSKNATSWNWNFGDGVNSTLKNPIHTYSAAGSYTVTLTVNNSAGSNTTIKSNYITVANSLNTLAADFSASPTSGSVPLSVNFTDKVSGSPTSWKWIFGDGSTSTMQDPVHTYNKTGLYSVTLTASKTGSSNSVTKSRYIAVSSIFKAPISAFSASPTSGSVPLIVTFNDQSSGSPTSWKWTFGDGNNSTQQNPVYTYYKTGKFNVALTTTNAAGSDTVTKYSCINVTAASGTIVPNPVRNVPVTAFSATPTSGNVPLSVSFTDQSTGSATTWKWTFGDGGTSIDKSPVYVYNKTGQFSVTLTASNANGSNALIKTSYIVVSNGLNVPETNFSASPTSGSVPLSVNFIDKTSGSVTAWKWSFGDGNASTTQNPVYKYNKTGLYSITLTTTNAGGSNALTKTSYIAVSNNVKNPIADFSASPVSGSIPLTVSFIDKSTGAPTAWKWLFGDGNFNNSEFSIHIQ